MSIRALSVLALFVIAALTAGIALRESTGSQRGTIAAGPDDGEAYALATAIAEVAERRARTCGSWKKGAWSWRPCRRTSEWGHRRG